MYKFAFINIHFLGVVDGGLPRLQSILKQFFDNCVGYGLDRPEFLLLDVPVESIEVLDQSLLELCISGFECKNC